MDVVITLSLIAPFAGTSNSKNDMLHDFALKAKVLEINPYSPLIQGLARQLEIYNEEKDEELLAKMKEVTSFLLDGALIRSGFDVPDKYAYVPIVIPVSSAL